MGTHPTNKNVVHCSNLCTRRAGGVFVIFLVVVFLVVVFLVVVFLIVFFVVFFVDVQAENCGKSWLVVLLLFKGVWTRHQLSRDGVCVRVARSKERRRRKRVRRRRLSDLRFQKVRCHQRVFEKQRTCRSRRQLRVRCVVSDHVDRGRRRFRQRDRRRRHQ